MQRVVHGSVAARAGPRPGRVEIEREGRRVLLGGDVILVVNGLGWEIAMNLSRHHFVADDLDELNAVAAELEDAGVPAARVHVLTRDDAGDGRRRSGNDGPLCADRNLVRSATLGAKVGALLATASLILALRAGWTDSAAGRVLFPLGAVLLFGLCAWSGLRAGSPVPNRRAERIREALDAGGHALSVDVDRARERALREVIARHPGLEPLGAEEAVPGWIVALENGTGNWRHWHVWRRA